jgi:FixJ family two-component response regulator
LKLYQQERPNIALVLLDVRMPGWDRVQTLVALQKLDAAVRCCFLTGHAVPSGCTSNRSDRRPWSLRCGGC